MFLGKIHRLLVAKVTIVAHPGRCQGKYNVIRKTVSTVLFLNIEVRLNESSHNRVSSFAFLSLTGRWA